MKVADKFLFGGDYNPEQWIDEPGILEEDVRMMKKAGVNVVSLGIFAWAEEEPEEGRYELGWLEDIINNLYKNGIRTILATPSGSRPRWLAEKYPEVLRVDIDRRRQLYGWRENHCMTSPIYREKVRQIDMKLAERFGKNPAVILWHISNEFSGDCYCPLCQDAFRRYVKRKYKTVDALNHAWWARFWSHGYTSFDQVEGPSTIGEGSIQGLALDWKRYTSDQEIDFMKEEIRALRDGGATQPVTTNMMFNFDGINYGNMAKELDVISWDSYPEWYGDDIYHEMERHSFCHDYMRCLKDQSFLLMESCTTGTNWQAYSKLKEPGLYTNEGLNAVAHGADSVMLFQIREGRGSYEKLHGALIDHTGRDDARVYLETSRVGAGLKPLSSSGLCGSDTVSSVALIYDIENRWALDLSAGPRNTGHGYVDLLEDFYHAFRRNGVNVDVIDETHPLDGYKIVAAPMLYMFRDGIEERLRKFVEKGGTLILTFWSGIVDENDLIFMGDKPHALTDVAGLRFEEIDTFPEERKNFMVPSSGEEAGSIPLRPSDGDGEGIPVSKYCELDHLDTAKQIYQYARDFYKGKSALAKNHYGDGTVYYLSAWPERGWLKGWIGTTLREQGIGSLASAVHKDLPEGSGETLPEKAAVTKTLRGKAAATEALPEKVAVTERRAEGVRYLIIQNFGENEQSLKLNMEPDKESAEQIFCSGEHGMSPDYENHHIDESAYVDMKPMSTKVVKIV